MKKIIVGIISALIVIGVIIGIIFGVKGNGKDKGNNTINNIDKKQLVRLNEVTRSVFYAPQYLAIANGFFDEEGIDIEITTGQGTDKVMTALLSGQSDIGLCGPEGAIYVYNEGRDNYVEVFAQLTKRDGSFLVSKEKIDNFTWDKVKGTTLIPGRKGGMPYMTLEYVLKKNGINPQTDLTLDDSIQFSLMAGAFAGGDAEFVTLFEPTASMTEAQGKGYVVTSIGKESGEVAYTAYCASKDYIEKNPKIVEGFTRAIYKGEQWVKNHTAKEVAEKIQKYFPDTSVESLTTSVQSYKDIDAWRDEPSMSEESFNRLQEIMIKAGELEKAAPYEIVNNNFAKKVVK